MKPLKVAIIGFGKQTKNDHFSYMLERNDIELVGIVDPYLSEDVENIAHFTNIEELLAATSVEAVLVATPHHTHFDITNNLLSRGIAVLKEKPLAMTLNQAVEMSRLSQAQNTPLLVNVQRRLMQHYLKGKELLPKIGEPFLVEGVYHIYVDNPHEGWRGDKRLAGGGCIIDMGYHLIDILTLYLGLPSSVIAHATNKAIPEATYDAEDTATLLVSYDSQLAGYLSISRFVAPKTEYLKITGNKGMLEITKKAVTLYASNGEVVTSIKATDPIAPVNHFLDVLQLKKPSLLDAEHHLNNMALIEAAYQSIDSNQIVKPRELLEAL